MKASKQFILTFITLMTITFQIAHANSSYLPRFEASEHTFMGDNVKIYFFKNDAGKQTYEFTLPNHLKASYGHIISFGDFYEIVNQPISHGKTLEEQETRFRLAFNSFALNKENANEAQQIIEVINQEKKAVAEGLARGEKAQDIFHKISDENNRQWNCITGGGCSTLTWWMLPGRYIELAKQDYDHFGNNAWLTYQVGHHVAIKEAIAAHATNDKKKLEIAYAMNAFACHFLTDRFAAGHIRTPRNELPTNVTPSVVGSLLVHFMHDEENANGIHVHNNRGDQWIAYGDRFYANPENNQSRLILDEALQISANQIFSAFLTGIMSETDEVENLIPHPDENNNFGKQDIAPLFYWDDKTKQLMRREDMTNLHDRHWTSDWWGWSTLVLLREQRGLDLFDQAALIAEGYGKEAAEYGLITDKRLISLSGVKRNPESLPLN